ncbi:MAG: hypothetical protein ACREV5_09110 [Steroidobacter sp.]
MHLPDIPEHVLQFIAEKIDTVPQLEALLLLWENQSQTWESGVVAARIYVRPDVCAEILQTLQRRELIRSEPGSPPRYRYNPDWDKSGDLMVQVATAYQRHLVPIATFIHSRGPSSVREFARAFDFKKER